MNSGLQCVIIITGPLIPVEPMQSVNSLDIVPAMLQHMSTLSQLDLVQEVCLCTMFIVMPEPGDWWTVTKTTNLAAMVTQLAFYVNVCWQLLLLYDLVLLHPASSTSVQ